MPSQETKKQLTVTLQIRELIYDVQTKTYNTAESLKASGKLKYDGAAHVMASDDEESLYELKRAIATAIGDAHVALSEFLAVGNTAGTFDNRLPVSIDGNPSATPPTQPTTISVVFQFPSNYKNASFKTFGNGLHDYIVNRAAYVWYRQVVPEIAQACLADADAALEQVNKAMYSRKRPVRLS